MKSEQEQTRLWLSIAIAFSLAGYRLFADLIGYSRQPIAPGLTPPLTDWLLNLLFFWVLALLWIAYRRWAGSVQREYSLEDVITSVRSVALIVVDHTGTVTLCNAAASALFGYDAAAMIGLKTDRLFDEEAPDGKLRLAPEAFEKSGFRVESARGRRLTGESFPLEVVTSLLKAGAGAVHILRDLTESKRAEAALREAKERAELINRITPSAVFTVDTDGLVTSWNRRAEEISGYAAAEVMGKTCRVFAESPCRDKCGLYAADILKPIRQRECTIMTKSGQRRVIVKNADCIRNEAGMIVGGVESFEDITERKETERKMAALFQDMQAMNALTMGREERILELKRDINALRVGAGLSPEYDLI